MRVTSLSDSASARYDQRRALIHAVRSIWGADSEMVYLVLWMWGSDEAAAMEPPDDVERLIAGAVSGPTSEEAAYVRSRLTELHDRARAHALLAA